MATRKVLEQPRPSAILMTPRELIQLAVAGAAVGLLILALYAIFDLYVFTPTLCSGAVSVPGRCENKLFFAETLAMIIGAIAGLFAVVQLRVFRPLLVVILVSAGLWGVIGAVIPAFPWWWAAVIAAFIFGIAYALFGWIVQIRNLIVAIVISLAVVLVLRLFLM